MSSIFSCSPSKLIFIAVVFIRMRYGGSKASAGKTIPCHRRSCEGFKMLLACFQLTSGKGSLNSATDGVIMKLLPGPLNTCSSLNEMRREFRARFFE